MLSVVEKPASDSIADLYIREGRVLFTPALARYALDTMNYTGQRRIETNHVKSLAAIMRAELFMAGSQIAFARVDGKLVLVNGQHRMAAVCECDTPQEFQVLITDCESMDSVRSMFWRFDAVLRPRSMSQILVASEIASKEGVRQGTAKAVYAAVAYILNEMKSPSGNYSLNSVDRRVADFRLELCKPFWPVARMFEVDTVGAAAVMNQRLRLGAVMSVILQTYTHQPDRAKLFWSSVASNDGLKSGDPRHSLVAFLLTTKAVKTDSDTVSGGCAAAWNAFYAGRTLAVIRPLKPLRLSGTPVGKTQVAG